ncbi:NYN domain-containing protein [uncultured Ruthenibacterium sp.]|uniref:NYN domain-containing protein n=1 Tax=uncultured Ruthenibacterium sp. TaxID=1905347 RepID=UPI00349E9668
MKKIVTGILAHVDAGKTTLSEALLYCGGSLRKLGRVDHQDAFLDTDHLERERGITIFSKQAILPLPAFTLTLLDTPGHVDFSGEMERTLQVLDYAVLVISGTDGIQSHTQTVWKLLERYRVPTFLFVNKMDLAGAEKENILQALQTHLSPACTDFSNPDTVKFEEEISLLDETLMNSYLETGSISNVDIASLIQQRKIFPCFFGSALRLEGVSAFLDGVQKYMMPPQSFDAFGAKIYKIARDSQGARLTYLKVTGGTLRVKDVLCGKASDGSTWQEKVDQIRIYSGARFQTVEQAQAGTVCAVTGLSRTWAGEGIGEEEDSLKPLLQPVTSCEIRLPDGCDVHNALAKLSQLEEEDPQLHIAWNEPLQEIQLQMMGEVQLDILKRLILERFGLSVGFGPGKILYKETISSPVIGIGHFEPLRHYAEVHLLLEPLARGSGLQFASSCSEDLLDRNWQRLILTHLAEKEHLGVLTASPLTDIKITLVAGRAHLKHTEGGDFRQATYRAVRQGLMQADNLLLEPWYSFRLDVPSGQIGRAMADIQRMGGTFEPPQNEGMQAVLCGRVPVATMRGYALELAGYTKGQGHLTCTLDGYEICHNTEQVQQEIGYIAERDTENPADSVFCSHGAGYVVPWNEVPAHAHVESRRPTEHVEPPSRPSAAYSHAATTSLEEDRELASIFERTYGPSKRRGLFRTPVEKPAEYHFEPSGPEYLLVDGYNIIFAWDELKELARTNLDAARQALADILCNYQGFRKCSVILVFDAYKVKRNAGEIVKYKNIHIVYTKEAETADMYIEKATYQLARHRRVRVATSDGAEQLIILGHGALRISASIFHEEIEMANMEIRQIIAEGNHQNELKMRS